MRLVEKAMLTEGELEEYRNTCDGSVIDEAEKIAEIRLEEMKMEKEGYGKLPENDSPASEDDLPF